MNIFTPSKFSNLKTRMQQHLSLHFAKHCVLCLSYLDIPGSSDSDFCPYCIKQLQRNLLSCQRCSIPMDNTLKDELICGSCQKTPPSFDKSIASFCYNYPLDKLISAFKFKQRLDLIPPLAKEMSKDLRISYDISVNKPDAIIPIPLHRIHEFKRGYNQANLLAKYLSKELNIPTNNHLLVRNKLTPKQSSLNKKQRQKNLRKAFTIKKRIGSRSHNVKLKHIALVDDVMTTGSTFEAASKALRKAGIERIDVWSLARAEI